MVLIVAMIATHVVLAPSSRQGLFCDCEIDETKRHFVAPDETLLFRADYGLVTGDVAVVLTGILIY